MLGLVAGETPGIPVHPKGRRKCSASGRAGRLGFLSTLRDKGNARPRGGRDAWARPRRAAGGARRAARGAANGARHAARGWGGVGWVGTSHVARRLARRAPRGVRHAGGEGGGGARRASRGARRAARGARSAARRASEDDLAKFFIRDNKIVQA